MNKNLLELLELDFDNKISDELSFFILNKLQELGYEINITLKDNNYVQINLIQDISDKIIPKVNIIPKVFLSDSMIKCLYEIICYLAGDE